MTPDDFDQMKPNSILVCPLTTPAWTQLFPHAIGLVTDIGSILAHGSIVAREYGIPAVLGVGDATQRIKSGQRIAIDGDRGLATPAGRRLTRIPGANLWVNQAGPPAFAPRSCHQQASVPSSLKMRV